MNRACTEQRGETNRSPIAMIVCGALAREVHQIAERRGWEVDIFGIPAEHHVHPDRIVVAVEEKLEDLAGLYRKTVVVYGDCGTAGALDRVLERHRAVRPQGPHCYSMLAGCNMERITEQIPETYFLTDYLVSRWETTVLSGMGLDKRPELKDMCFAGFKRLIFLRQNPDGGLEEKAQEIARFLGLPLETWNVGLAGLEAHLEAALLEE